MVLLLLTAAWWSLRLPDRARPGVGPMGVRRRCPSGSSPAW
jgi:hypothetical protein